MTQADLPLFQASPPHRACTQLMVAGLSDDTVSQFVLGLDNAPRLMSADDMAASLNDPLATKLLRAGIFPNTAGELLHALEQVDPGGPLSRQQFFLVGEGSQLPADELQAERNMRFLIACGAGQFGAEVVISSFHPEEGMIEVAAWDAVEGGYNFYRTMPDSNAWMFAGNSRHALTEPTRGQGPFESHVNGNLLMKELKTPWVNWDSPFANIPRTSLKAQGLDSHPWMDRLEPGGGYALQDQTVQPSIVRWTAARIAAIKGGSSSETPVRMLEQLTSTMTVNLVSSFKSAAPEADGASTIDLPSTFFVDADLLATVGLPGPPRLSVSSSLYIEVLGELGVRLEDGGAFSQSTDTHFAFVVPERAFEDVETIRQATAAGLLTTRLVACLGLVDFPNPVFSRRRGALTKYAVQTQWTGDGATFSQAIADAIIASPEASTSGTAEGLFAANWAVGEDFVATFSAELTAYYSRLTTILATKSGVRDVYSLADSRRRLVEALPIFESRLLFPVSNTHERRLEMIADATVEEVEA